MSMGGVPIFCFPRKTQLQIIMGATTSSSRAPPMVQITSRPDSNEVTASVLDSGSPTRTKITTSPSVDRAIGTVLADQPMTAPRCSTCKRHFTADIIKSTGIFWCIQCPDFLSCSPCLLKPGNTHHPRHYLFFDQNFALSEFELALLGMQAAVCDGCGLAVGGITWACSQCMHSEASQGQGFLVLCTSCFSNRDQKHPDHTDFIRVRSLRYPSTSSILLKCKGCKSQIWNSMWACSDCEDMQSCDACLGWLKTHNPEHLNYGHAVMELVNIS